MWSYFLKQSLLLIIHLYYNYFFFYNATYIMFLRLKYTTYWLPILLLDWHLQQQPLSGSKRWMTVTWGTSGIRVKAGPLALCNVRTHTSALVLLRAKKESSLGVTSFSFFFYIYTIRVGNANSVFVFRSQVIIVVRYFSFCALIQKRDLCVLHQLAFVVNIVKCEYCHC